MSAVSERRLWRVAGGLAIAHVVLLFGSFSVQRVAPLEATQGTVIADHVRWSMAKGFSGGYVTCLSMLVFVLAATLLARLLRADTQVSDWVCSTITAAAAIYVAVTLGSELANLGAALYDGHHGASLETVTAFDHAHWFAVFLATSVLGLFTLAVAAAVRVSGALPRWVAYTGFVTGVACIVAVPGAGSGLVDTATILWVLWFVGLAVAALRRPNLAPVPAPAQSRVSV